MAERHLIENANVNFIPFSYIKQNKKEHIKKPQHNFIWLLPDPPPRLLKMNMPRNNAKTVFGSFTFSGIHDTNSV